MYLCYIGVKAILGAIRIKLSTSKNKEFNVTDTTESRLFRSYAEGFFTQILNPKVSMFYLAAFPLFINFNLQNYIFLSFVLVAIHASIIFLWFTVFTLLFKKIKLLFAGSGLAMKYLQALTGGVLVYFGLLLLREP